jgi:hypothetical protein
LFLYARTDKEISLIPDKGIWKGVASRYAHPGPYSLASSQTALADSAVASGANPQKSKENTTLRIGMARMKPITISLVTCALCSSSEIKAITQNHLGNQVVCRTRDAHAEAEIDLPLRSNIQINRREDLVLLPRDRIESRYRAD